MNKQSLTDIIFLLKYIYLCSIVLRLNPKIFGRWQSAPMFELTQRAQHCLKKVTLTLRMIHNGPLKSCCKFVENETPLNIENLARFQFHWNRSQPC